jgi:hypothetical protein
MTIDKFGMNITFSDHSYFICLIVLSHARKPVPCKVSGSSLMIVAVADLITYCML